MLKTRKLKEVRDPNCTKCGLSKTTNGSICVFGRGILNARIFLVGEAPGAAEEATGKPFMGRSGQLLNQVLNRLSMTELCYISNAVRCRPPNNRRPTMKEVAACRSYLYHEIAIIRPRVVVAMGATARASLGIFGNRDESIKLYFNGRPIHWLTTVHPAFCLRAGKTAIREFSRHLKLAKELANANLH